MLYFLPASLKGDKNMKIVVLDGYAENPGDLSWEELEKLGELTVYDRTPPEDAEIIRRIGDAEIVVTNKTPISGKVLDSCSSVKYITVLATGYNAVDCARARARKIPVSNVPTYGTEIVAQSAIALLLEICHHIGHHDRSVHEGGWEKCPDFCYWDYPLIELAGKTMGIIGFGRIGRRTGKIAKAIGMRVLAHDSSECNEGRTIAEYTDIDRLLAESDVIALHCPLLPETAEIINKKTIAKMKEGVIIINNSRGPLINERDLSEALESGRVYAAGIDVVSVEPIRKDNPLLAAKNCVITPHISWAAKESRMRIMERTAENIKSYLARNPENVVN